MRSSLPAPFGLVLVLVGLVWTAQGIGWLEGSPMTDEGLWAVLGPMVMVAGAGLVYLGVRRRD